MSWFHHLFLPHHSNNQRAKLLHPSSLALIIGLFALFQIGLSHLVERYPLVLGYAAAQISPTEVIRLTNVEREKAGLADVKFDNELSIAASQKAADMFARDYWAHVSPIGTQPWYFITQAGYVYRYAGENLARDFSDPASVVTAWMNSPSHKENLLNPKYQDIGVAVVDGKLQGKETTLVVQMFGTRLSGAPEVGKTASFVVKAQEENPGQTTPILPTSSPQQITSVSQVSPFNITRAISIGFLAILLLVLVVDVVVISRRKVVRWTSKSLAHLMFVAMLLVAILTVIRGQIL